jgi:large subunit ribosomal protein L21
MYAVIRSGGKQLRVAEGEQIQVELLGLDDGAEVFFEPVLLVDGETVLAEPGALSGVSVTGRVLGEVKGKKVTGFTYKPKTNNRRRYGHRQRYTSVEITSIERGRARAGRSKATPAQGS